MAITVKEVRSWLDALSSEVTLPGQLPAGLAEVKSGWDLGQARSWVPLPDGTDLPLKSITDKNREKLSFRAKAGDVPIGVRLLTRKDAPTESDGVYGIALELPVTDALKSLGSVGGTDLALVLEIWHVGKWSKPMVGFYARAWLPWENGKRVEVLGTVAKSGGVTSAQLMALPPPGGGWSLTSLLAKITGGQEIRLPPWLPKVRAFNLMMDTGGSGTRFLLWAVDETPATTPWLVALLPKSAKESRPPVVVSVLAPLGATTRLSSLGLLRGQIPAEADVRVRVQAVYASQKIAAESLAELNAAVGGGPLPDRAALGAGLTLLTWVSTGDTTYKLRVRRPAPAAIGEDDAEEGGSLIRTERTLGPLHLRQVRLRLLPASGSRKERLLVELDAAFVAAGFELEATGLGMEIELVEEPTVRVVLRGLGVAYARDPLRVMGALVARPADETCHFAYDGLIMVKAATWGLLAVGSYARIKGTANQPDYVSLFVFGALEGRVNGPPPVVFTGLALGFGYNSSVALPEADRVTEFPFVRALGNMKELTGVGPDEPVSATEVLRRVTGGTGAVVGPANGVMWLAAGLSCSIAETVDVAGLLMVQFGGDDLLVALLGRVSADFPARSTGGRTPAVAHLELGFRALYEHVKRQFSLTAALTDNSWIVHPDCKVTGGAAVYVWFPGSANEGDFVATVGGYHPAFPVPGHYPQVPRLGLSWSVSSAVAVKGELYVAVTPKAGMVGGRLEVHYDAGGLRAWLIAYFNVTVWWAPLSFRAEIGVTVGASYTLDAWVCSVTTRVEIAATLVVWGPPTGGRVHLKTGPFSVTARFGDSREPWGPLGSKMSWTDFAARQLPAAPLTIGALDGLLTDPVKVRQATTARGDRWVVSTDGFTFAARTVIPVTKLVYNTAAQSLNDRPKVGGRERDRSKHLHVRPVQYTGSSEDCTLTVTVDRTASDGTADTDLTSSTEGWPVKPLYAAVPDALWGVRLDAPPPADKAAEDTTAVYAVGLQVRIPPPALEGDRRDTSLEVIKYTPETARANPLKHGASTRTAPGDPGMDQKAAAARLRKVLTDMTLLEVLP
ncbi:hypothetical protein D0T12_22430 [Actinomadura spongiicola]|uniref:DUF6603 domain-containing protein n=1 Tax=Actinomadura spongiicola TaxID=2303421 RepID=A0A372GC63_9ACTN|nr:DUF6603 domain-containing protein [Actinomadura spongiicola]RFS82961.1 hypothetical protein D0T12_22430 [Actinomadura spongiicola]